MRKHRRRSSKIYIRLPGENMTLMDAERNETIASLTRKIWNRHKIPNQDQMASSWGRLLLDRRTLKSYSLEDTVIVIS